MGKGDLIEEYEDEKAEYQDRYKDIKSSSQKKKEANELSGGDSKKTTYILGILFVIGLSVLGYYFYQQLTEEPETYQIQTLNDTHEQVMDEGRDSN